MSVESIALRRLAAALAAAALVVLGAAAPGWAHAVQLSVQPADGSSVPQLPDAVVVTFNEAPQELGTQASAEGPAGPVDAPVTISGHSVEIALPEDAPAGRWMVRWRVTSADGHPIQGSTTFTADRGAGGADVVGEPTRTPLPDGPAANGQSPGGQSTAAPTGGGTDADTAQPGGGDPAGEDVAVSDTTDTNGATTLNPDESPAESAEDAESSGLSGTTLLVIGVVVALGAGAGVWLALSRRRKD